MTIRRGEAWGEAAPLPEGAPLVDGDAALRRLVEAALAAGDPGPIGPVGLLGGDLCRTVGGRGDRARLTSPEAVTLPVDVLAVVLDDGTQHHAVAHVVARRPAWLGHALVAMNAQWLGDWDLAPRSHPNDGLVDITEGRLPFGDRREARRRAPSGSHLPHPALRTRRVASATIELPAPLPVRLDGEPVGRARHLRIEVRPDALLVVV